MKPRFSHLFSFFFAFALRPLEVGAQTIPVDHFEGLHFDAPVPAVVLSGQDLPLSADLLESGWEEALFSFRPIDGDGPDLDFFVQHLAGRIERTIVFAAAQADTYEVVLFAGSAEQLEFHGVFSPFVVTATDDPLRLPALFFDGLLLDAPLPPRIPLGAAPPLAGRILDDRIVSARFDLSRGDTELKSVGLPLTDGRFDQPLRFPVESAGPLRVELVVGLQDGTFWGRGSFLFEMAAADGPQAAPAVLAAALLPGGQADISIANLGEADLLILDATTAAPFEVVSTPAPIPPGSTGLIGVRYDGSGGDEGDLIVDTNDPLRPRRHVALRGVSDSGTATSLTWERADVDGVLTAVAPPGFQRFALALFSSRHLLDRDTGFPFSVGPPPPAARAARPVPTARERGEAIRARKSDRLAAQVRSLGRPARRAAQVSYAVGDERTFVFDEFAPVPRQLLPTRVVAVSERAVAFVHVGSAADGGDLSVDDIRAHLAGFDADYGGIVAAFGAPSDVDGDGRIAFLYTPLVDDVGLGGFQDPASVLEETVGGSGNRTDLLFLSPTQPAPSYRSLLVHEFQHLINFHQHVLVRGGESEATWLDEGLSHLAEDLVDGFVSGGNSDNVHDFLADPGAVGLTAQDHVSAAERGAAYLFVRSLVDRFGPAILLRLVQTGLSDRDTVEEAAGVPFRELLAGYAVQLYASGTGLAGHSRFDFSFAGLGGPDTRGFPQPAVLSVDEGELAGTIRPRGVAFVEVEGPVIQLQASVDAELGAVLLPLPADFVARIDIPGDHFAGVHFDPPLPGGLAVGEPIVIRGQVAGTSATRVTAQYSGPDGNLIASFVARVDGEGRFGRTVVFAQGQTGDLELDVFVGDDEGGDFAGSFAPVRVRHDSGPVFLPRGFFDGVTLDAPLPTRIAGGAQLTVSGDVADGADGAVDRVILELVSAGDDRVDFRADVEGGRFEIDLALESELEGEWELRLFTGVDGDFSYRGGFDIVIGGTITAVAEESAVLPESYALSPPYPNPFNASAIIPLTVSGTDPVDVAVYSLGGQRLVTLHSGQLTVGAHQLRWDGHDLGGRPTASGVYLVRVVAGDWRAARKVLLLR